jgi:hypothetical protein
MTQGIFMPNYRPFIRRDIYTTDFREYTLGVQPGDWTSRYATTGFTATVETVPGSLSGQALRWTKTAVTRQFLSWDRVPLAANVEILCRYRAIETWANGEAFAWLMARASGGAGTETGYLNRTYGQTSSTRWAVDFGMYNAGTSSNLGNNQFGPSPNYVVNEWAWSRFNVSGTTLRRKAWHSAAAEPATWAETITNSTITAAGWTGLFNPLANPDVEIDFFGVGLNGQTVPLPA